MKLIFLFAEDLGIDEQTFLDYFHSDKTRRKPKIPFRKLYNLHNLFPTMLVENNGKYKVIEQGYASLSDLQQRIEALKTKHFSA